MRQRLNRHTRHCFANGVLLRDWLLEDEVDLAALEQGRRAAHEWLASGKKEEFIIHRGYRLQGLSRLMNRNDFQGYIEKVGHLYVKEATHLERKRLQEQELVVFTSFYGILFLCLLSFGTIYIYVLFLWVNVLTIFDPNGAISFAVTIGNWLTGGFIRQRNHPETRSRYDRARSDATIGGAAMFLLGGIVNELHFRRSALP